MGGGFSKSTSAKKPPAGTISSVDRAVLDLKNARDRLSRYKKKLELDDAKIIARAKREKEAGRTKTALNLLRVRKIKQNEVDVVEGQLLNVLQMVGTIDSKQNEAQVLAALKTGKDSLQKMHEETSVDDVLDLMDQIQEQNQVEQEISDILAGAPTSLSVQDEAAVEAELEALIQEQQQQQQQTTTVELPTAPQTKLPEHLPVAPTTDLPAIVEPEKKVAVAS
jgi:type I site-specific restriction-modification system R (restriction) subunit